jgi:aspartyl-tRNA(Asn)/glutamyl-tRNA(Gln) amidotransferase subunit A
MDLLTSTAVEIRELVASGKVSAREVASAFLKRIESVDPKVRAFLHVNPEWTYSFADAVDKKRAAGKPLGLMAGVPVALKDVLCTKGVPTTCASKILKNYLPPYNATAVSRLIAADAVPVGKTNMDEFAMGSSTENSAYFTTSNPWNLDCIPGGSSGGSAAAVAAGMAPVSLGSDTGGSIRQPAALCSVAGLKPTYGRVSRYGLVAFASSLDQIGPFSTTVRDSARVLRVIAGHDECDSTSIDAPVEDYEAALDGIKGLKIGVPKEYFVDGLDKEIAARVKEALAKYEQLGAELVDISLPHSPYGVATYYIVATAEASSNLARYDGVHYGYRAKGTKDIIELYAKTREEGFGAEVKRRIMLGTFVLSSGFYDAYYIKGLKVRRLIKNDFDEAFKSCHVIAGPTTPTPAFRKGEKSSDPLAMYLSDIFTISANLAGLPGMSIPCGFTSAGLPVGLQLTGRILDEKTVLRAGAAYEAATPFHKERPKGL